MSWQVALLGC